METINRLLKKQSSRRAKKEALAGAASTQISTPLHGDDSDAEAESGSGGGETKASLKEVNMYRWISNKEGLSFAIPMGFLPKLRTPPGETESEAQAPASQPQVTLPNHNVNLYPARPIPQCSVSGCEAQRKYRLVKSFERGACGMEHLRVLQA